MQTCSIEGCSKKLLARGWCSLHYQRWRRHGDPLAVAPKASLEERFWASVSKGGPIPARAPWLGQCWTWVGKPDDGGYGRIDIGGLQRIPAHRVSWTIAFGDIKPGVEVDHRCRNRACVNPDHLRLATRKQNREHLDLYANNKSGYRGVSFHAQHKKWMVSVRHNGRTIHGGYFDDVHDAGAAARVLRNHLFTHNDLDRSAA